MSEWNVSKMETLIGACGIVEEFGICDCNCENCILKLGKYTKEDE